VGDDAEGAAARDFACYYITRYGGRDCTAFVGIGGGICCHDEYAEKAGLLKGRKSKGCKRESLTRSIYCSVRIEKISNKSNIFNLLGWVWLL
jgi:hypothetical protein